jgi:hypothetical protein
LLQSINGRLDGGMGQRIGFHSFVRVASYRNYRNNP